MGSVMGTTELGVQLGKWGYPIVAGWFIRGKSRKSKMDDDWGFLYDELEPPSHWQIVDLRMFESRALDIYNLSKPFLTCKLRMAVFERLR